MYPYTFKSQVYSDIQSAYLWYEAQRKGLGEDFLLTLENAFSNISQSPLLYPTVYKNIHRILIRRFPYGIFYLIRDNQLVIIAVLHTRANPSKWKTRT